MIQRFVAAAFGVVVERATLLHNLLRSKVAQQKSGVSSALDLSSEIFSTVATTTTTTTSLWVCAVCRMRCAICLGLVLGFGVILHLGLGLGSDLGQKFGNCACTFYKLHRLTNSAQRAYDKTN